MKNKITFVNELYDQYSFAKHCVFRPISYQLRCTAHLVTSCIRSIRDVTITKIYGDHMCPWPTHHYKHTTSDFGSVLIKDRTKLEESKICHNWFWIDYFRWNLHLIIEILVYICWRSEFIIARLLCWEITRNNAVNYFEFCPVFVKDCLHFRKGDASAPPLWWVPICTFQILEPVVLSIFLNFLIRIDRNQSDSKKSI